MKKAHYCIDWYDKSKRPFVEELIIKFSVFDWCKSATAEQQETALIALRRAKEIFSTVKPDKKYCINENDIFTLRIIKAKTHLMEGDYWNCCHELSDVFELEPVFQVRIIVAMMELLKGV